MRPGLWPQTSDLLRQYVRQIFHRRRKFLHLGTVAGTARVGLELRRHLIQGC